jgi:hypothetical protein
MLCALVFCAFSSASASAAGTTAGECSNKATTKDFTDADCLTSGTGEFGHILFKAAETVNVTAKNTTPFVLEGKVAGVPVKIECKKVSGTGTITNHDNGTEPMTVTFGNSTTSFTECAVLAPVNKCSVVVGTTTAAESDPMTLGLGEEITGPTGELVKVYQEGKGTEMGLKFSSVGTNNFTTLTFSSLAGQTCPEAFTKAPIPVKGSAIAIGGRGGGATSSGATAVFTKASTLGGLTTGGQPSTLEGTLTFNKKEGNPLIITTTTP